MTRRTLNLGILDDELSVPYARLRQELAAQTQRALVYPVFFGSAVTGAGVPELMAGLAGLLPAGTGDAGGPVSGRVFKIERGPGGEKLAYVRMFSGTIRTRDRPSTTAAHFRKLTPLVLMAALDQAGTIVCEPMIRVSLEIPAETVGSVLAAVARLGGSAGTPVLRADLDPLTVVRTLLPAARAQDLQHQLPGLTSGEGVAETSLGGYRPVTGPPPARPRTLADPRNREEYMMRLAGRATTAPLEQSQSSGGR